MQRWRVLRYSGSDLKIVELMTMNSHVALWMRHQVSHKPYSRIDRSPSKQRASFRSNSGLTNSSTSQVRLTKFQTPSGNPKAIGLTKATPRLFLSP
jgi:hypothetical protein